MLGMINSVKFSVLMSVYSKENPVFLTQALDSLLNQTLRPAEIVLVKDGLLSKELDDVIDDFTIMNNGLFKIIGLNKNVGLGKALAVGIEYCTNDFIARMDSDDISLPNRFFEQLSYLLDNPDIDVIGSAIEEFNQLPGDLNRFRILPINNEELMKFSKFRNPFNHPTVFFRKEAILKAGSYVHMPFFEDFYLWIRVINKGFRLTNLKQVHLYFRIGNDMIARRHGFKYLLHELNFFNESYKLRNINFGSFIYIILTRIFLRLLPKRILEFIYKKFVRI
jgi:glycosyltransferase involved in cell wall biosynthesis